MIGPEIFKYCDSQSQVEVKQQPIVLTGYNQNMDVVNYQKCENGGNEDCFLVEIEGVGIECIIDEDIIRKIVEDKDNLLSSENNTNVKFDEKHDAVLDDEEKQEWKNIFLKLDEVDTTRQGVVSVEVLTKIINQLEDKRSLFHLGPQTDKKIERLDC